MEIYNIPEQNWIKLSERIDKITRKAKKLGKKLPILNIIGEYSELVDADKKLYRTFYKVTIQSEPIIVNGWEFMASIDITDDPNLGRVLRKVPGVTKDLPTNYRSTTDYCEHCNLNRRRNTVYVLYNNSTNEWKQVGRNCLKDFLLIQNPEDIVKYMETYINFNDLCSGAQQLDYFGFGGDDYKLELRSTLKLTAFLIEKNGWLSRSKSLELSGDGVFKPATADVVKELYTVSSAYLSPSSRELLEEYNNLPEGKYEEEIEEAIDWIMSINPEESQDYMYNLYTVCRSDVLDKKHIAIACSLLPAYRKTKLPKPEVVVSKHVGVINNKEEFALKVVDIKYWPNNFGGTTAIFFKDLEGNSLLWKASKDPEIEVGLHYMVRGTVKNHSFYREKAQTELTRCKILGVISS